MTEQPVGLDPALQAEYLRRGWRITKHGHVELGSVTGPCAGCQQTTVRYGSHGQPLCLECRRVHR